MSSRKPFFIFVFNESPISRTEQRNSRIFIVVRKAARRRFHPFLTEYDSDVPMSQYFRRAITFIVYTYHRPENRLRCRGTETYNDVQSCDFPINRFVFDGDISSTVPGFGRGTPRNRRLTKEYRQYFFSSVSGCVIVVFAHRVGKIVANRSDNVDKTKTVIRLDRMTFNTAERRLRNIAGGKTKKKKPPPSQVHCFH